MPRPKGYHHPMTILAALRLFTSGSRAAMPRVMGRAMLALSAWISAATLTSGPPDPYAWAAQHRLVAHANGAINGQRFTNSREAFLANYRAGFRVFEMDLNLTSDGHLVAVHDWSPTTLRSLGLPVGPKTRLPLTQRAFARMKIHRSLTPLTLQDALRLLMSHRDAWLVTDTKIASGPELATGFKDLVQTAKRTDPKLLDRIIPQVYNQDMYWTIRAIHPFRSWIYTLYMSKDSEDQILDFTQRTGIRAVTMPAQRANQRFLFRLRKQGVFTYTHTVNSAEKQRKQEDLGVHGLYTDILLPRP